MDFSPYLGLSRIPSSCIGSQGEIVNDTPGKTEVYMDDVPEAALKRVNKDFNTWVSRDWARTLASQTLNADLRAFLGAWFSPQRTYAGALGKSESTQYVSPPSQTISLLLSTGYFPGATLQIPTAGLLLSESVTDQVIELYVDNSPTPAKSFTILSIPAGSKKQYALPEDWKIELDGSRYELRTTLPDGVKVANNKKPCGGCGGNGDLPQLVTDCCSGTAGGWMIMLRSDCNFDPLLEQLISNDRTKRVLGFMLAYQACYVLCAQPPSGQVERATVLSESDLSQAAALCKQEYLNRLNWLKTEAKSLNLSTAGTCFKPANTGGWARSSFIR